MADTFVFLDDVEFTKQSFTRRVKIHHQADFTLGRYLSIPLDQHSDKILIKDLTVSSENSPLFWRDMLAIVHNTYCHSPFYGETYPFLESLIQDSEEIQNLSILNQFIIRKISAYLEIKSKYVLSSELLKSIQAEHVNHQICKSLGATKYISGQGAKKYQSEEWYEQEGIQIEYFDISKINVIKSFSTHLLDKSIISWLMLHGKEKVSSLF